MERLHPPLSRLLHMVYLESPVQIHKYIASLEVDIEQE